jgi:hypothetical protein
MEENTKKLIDSYHSFSTFPILTHIIIQYPNVEILLI